MSEPEDIIIVGAGPAGTSAALALAGRGWKVRLLDAGSASVRLPPAGSYLALRFGDAGQWKWQLGEDFSALDASAGNSPKLRVPGMRGIFAGYAQANRIEAEGGFQLLGALAPGGLSNAWGCGVAAFDDEEWSPLDARRCAAMREGYARVATRMGLGGRNEDPLAELIGVDAWAGAPVALDRVHAHIAARGAARARPGFALGRARVAVLTSDRAEDGGSRQACDLSGLCLWGCPRRATWSAALDLEAVRRAGVAVETDVRVDALGRDAQGWRLDCTSADGPRQLHASKVLLAAGTIASTRLALAALEAPPPSVRLQSNPMAAFLAVVPSQLGRAHERGFGLAQLSFALTDAGGKAGAFGNLFSTAGLPVSEFLPYLPLSRRAGLPLLRALLPACTVGNVFLPGALSEHSASLSPDGTLRIRAGASAQLAPALAAARAAVGKGLRAAGAWMLPGSFVPGQPGADLHYAATLPMRAQPLAHECSLDGEVAGLPGVYAIDGASLPQLPAKAHTLSIMANADRIARALS